MKIDVHAIRRLVREAVDDSMFGTADPALTINNLDKFRDLIGSLVTFAEQFEHPLWDDLADAIVETISSMSEFVALEKAIEGGSAAPHT
jgi:hypothetical protein